MKIERYVVKWSIYRDTHIRRVFWANLAVFPLIVTVTAVAAAVIEFDPFTAWLLALCACGLQAWHIGRLLDRKARLNSPELAPYRNLYALAAECLDLQSARQVILLSDCALEAWRGNGPFIVVDRFDHDVAEALMQPDATPPSDPVIAESFRILPHGTVCVPNEAEVRFDPDGEVLFVTMVQPPALQHFQHASRSERQVIAEASTVSDDVIAELTCQLEELLDVLRPPEAPD